jgi:hypothetical protein
VTLLRHRTTLFLLAVALAWIGWEAFLELSVSRRLAPEVSRALGQSPTVNVVVTLGFAPEEFHVRVFQTHGVVSGVQGTAVRLDRVAAADVARIARYYWVRRIALR